MVKNNQINGVVELLLVIVITSLVLVVANNEVLSGKQTLTADLSDVAFEVNNTLITDDNALRLVLGEEQFNTTDREYTFEFPTISINDNLENKIVNLSEIKDFKFKLALEDVNMTNIRAYDLSMTFNNNLSDYSTYIQMGKDGYMNTPKLSFTNQGELIEDLFVGETLGDLTLELTFAMEEGYVIEVLKIDDVVISTILRQLSEDSMQDFDFENIDINFDVYGDDRESEHYFELDIKELSITY